MFQVRSHSSVRVDVWILESPFSLGNSQWHRERCSSSACGHSMGRTVCEQRHPYEQMSHTGGWGMDRQEQTQGMNSVAGVWGQAQHTQNDGSPWIGIARRAMPSDRSPGTDTMQRELCTDDWPSLPGWVPVFSKLVAGGWSFNSRERQ